MNNEIKIPKEFELFGRTVKVEWDNDVLNDKELYGQANYRKNVIAITNTCCIDGKMKKLPQDNVNETYFHELVHFILNSMKHELNDDEKFVNDFSGLLHQALKTAKYK